MYAYSHCSCVVLHGISSYSLQMTLSLLLRFSTTMNSDRSCCRCSPHHRFRRPSATALSPIYARVSRFCPGASVNNVCNVSTISQTRETPVRPFVLCFYLISRERKKSIASTILYYTKTKLLLSFLLLLLLDEKQTSSMEDENQGRLLSMAYLHFSQR